MTARKGHKQKAEGITVYIAQIRLNGKMVLPQEQDFFLRRRGYILSSLTNVSVEWRICLVHMPLWSAPDLGYSISTHSSSHRSWLTEQGEEIFLVRHQEKPSLLSARKWDSFTNLKIQFVHLCTLQRKTWMLLSFLDLSRERGRPSWFLLIDFPLPLTLTVRLQKLSPHCQLWKCWTKLLMWWPKVRKQQWRGARDFSASCTLLNV